MIKPEIVEVIKNHGIGLIQRGPRFVARCPFHDEKTPSFYVSPDRQTYHCFGCGCGGDVIAFVMQLNKMDFKAAIKHLGIENGKPTKIELNKNLIKRQQRQRYERWEREKTAELSLDLRVCRNLIAGIRTEDDMDKFGDAYKILEKLEYEYDLFIQYGVEDRMAYFEQELAKQGINQWAND